ncbi:tyrosine-protein kinase family protein [Pontibacillus salicampi]|uniref:Tyrosine-protein kinase family protein n=1 Tax=Pontibacillus salicampi TaxID=1449801 RepID=A0ABV6LT13_9BACI
MQSPIEDIVRGGPKKKKGIVSFDQMKVIGSKVEKYCSSLFMVTSIREGKSVALLTAELAASIALKGKKVLLVEGELNKPRLHEWFQLEQPTNTGKSMFPPIQSSFLSGLDIQLINSINENSIDIWLSHKFKQRMERWQKAYDTVIISAPSMQSGPDAELLAEACHQALFVIERKKDKLSNIQEAQTKLEMANCDVIGVICQR